MWRSFGTRITPRTSLIVAGLATTVYDRFKAGVWCLSLSKPAQITSSRLMTVGDSNLAGNVHGGTILDMIESAGYIAACRHVKPALQSDELLALARIERVDFLQPMHVGELSQLEAKVVGVGAHSVEVVVNVHSENLRTGEVRRTNQARLWYVYLDTSREKFNLLKVPKLELDAKEESLAQNRYKEQKTRRAQQQHTTTRAEWDKQQSSYPSAVNLSLLLNPADCITQKSSPTSLVKGGPVMKLIDSAAGMVAFRHCKTNVVTACIDALDLVKPIRLSDVVHISARPTFASARSLEVEVIVEAEDFNTGKRELTTRGLLTFVSLSEEGKPMSLPPLIPTTEGQKQVFVAGEQRYLERKQVMAEERARGLKAR